MENKRYFAVSLAREAGAIMKKYFAQGYGVERKQKEDHSPVTEADLAIDQLVRTRISRQYPEHGIYLEESGQQPSSSDYVWVCDPLDGTVPFSRGIPTFAFSLALVFRGQPIIGVAYDASFDRMFIAEKGCGAWMNDQRLVVSSSRELAGSVVGIECNLALKNFNFTGLCQEAHRQNAMTMTMCSIVYSGLLVANGQFMAAVYAGNKPYDVAALKVIVEEAGGRVTDLAGHDQCYDQLVNGLVASNGYVHDWIVKLLQKS